MSRKTAYEEALKRLNIGQRKAVEVYEGVVMVLAGPGTGKTQLLATRIGYILQHTDTDPESILCLTYTDAGTIAIRKRLLELIGPTSYRINIHTFHSFCRKVITNNAVAFDLETVEIASELDKITIVRTLLDTLPYSNPLMGGTSKYTMVKDLLELFATMKKEGWSKTFMLQHINTYLESLPSLPAFQYQRNGKGYKKGDPKQKDIDKLSRKMKILAAAVELFPEYKEALSEQGLYDYEDMLVWVYDAFNQDAELLQSIQESFLYFLVDEFQDTSGLQNKILNQLIGYWENPNIMVVGDDDQCIFEFQGASLQNLEGFRKQHQQHLLSVVLDVNYRSGQGLLDHAFQLINHNQQRLIYQLESLKAKPLTAFKGAGEFPKVVVYKNPFQESIGIFNSIQNLLEQGIQPGEIAVIYPRHTLGENLLTLMEQANIPFQVKRKTNVLREEAFINVKRMYEYCYAEYQKPYAGEGILFQLLHIPFFDIPFSDIRKIAYFIQQATKNEPFYYLDVLEDEQWLAQLQLKNPEKIVRFREIIEKLLKAFHVYSGAKWFELALNYTGLLDYYRTTNMSALQLRVLHTAMDFIRSESSKHSWLSVEELFAIFTRMEEERLPLPIYNHFTKSNAVQLLTAHSSKGQEFDYVFLMGSLVDQWEQAKGRTPAFDIPPTLTKEQPEQDIEERRRLFYVAVTRARKQLEISYPAYSVADKSQTPTRFISELALPADQEVYPELSQELLLEHMQSLLVSHKPNIQNLEVELREAAANHVFSASSLEVWHQCPIRFYYTYLLKIPSLLSTEAAYGRAIHRAAAKALEGRSKENGPLLPVHEVVEIFEDALRKYEYCFEKGAIDYYLNLGTARIKQYMELQAAKAEKVRVEWMLSQTEIEGVPVKGILDKVVFLDDSQLLIEDLKTSSKSFKDYTKSFDTTRGKYFRQLAFYQLLIQASFGLRYDVIGTRLQYLETDSEDNLPLIDVKIKEQELAETRQWIVDSKEALEQGNFEGCGKEDCHWCNMELHIQRQSSFESIQSDLDDFIE